MAGRAGRVGAGEGGETDRGSRYLSLLERRRIASLRSQGLGMREIGRRLGRAPSTISRELGRNVFSHDDGVYDADLAHAQSRERARRGRAPRLATDTALNQMVQAKLVLEWSPEQLSGWLRDEQPDRPDWHLCHEPIYRALYHGGHGGLSREFTRRPRTGRPLRKPRRRPSQRRPRFAVPGALIDERPVIVEKRLRIGDWEGDLITGRHNPSAIGTLVDRHSRVVKLIHLPDGHRAEALLAALTQLLQAEIPHQARLNLTWDQGSEMACHADIAHLFSDGMFFANPGRPWERGSNENTNGLPRQYFPKRTDLTRFTAADLKAVEDRLNRGPRKTLHWQSSAQIYTVAHQSQ